MDDSLQSLEADVVVLGSGFAGSLTACALHEQGRRVLLVERSQHPRFAIGESSTPLTNLLLEELAKRYRLPEMLSLTKWGSWQRKHPEIGCGLKRGFSFYHHVWDRPFSDTSEHRNQLLVAASPHDGIADTHWYRPDFDHYLLQIALRRGVAYFDHTEISAFHPPQNGMARLEGVRSGRRIDIRCRLVIDATGTRGCLHRLLGSSEAAFEDYPATETIFAHFQGVGRVADLSEFQTDELPPYPPDDAALHHVFEGGWIWVLPFNNGITSAGAALLPRWADRIRDSDGSLDWDRLLEHLPSVRRQFAAARPVTPFFRQRPMPFLTSRCQGPGWVMLPSAMGFVDPLLSTGFPLVLCGVQRTLHAVHEHWGGNDLDRALARSVERSLSELHRVSRLIRALYDSMSDFPRFVTLTRLYFAAVSYAESARRLGHFDLAGDSFLLGDRASFVGGMDECLRLASRISVEELAKKIDEVIDPIDVAGLTRRDRRHWLPVDPADLFAAAAKLRSGPEALEESLRRSGFYREIEAG